MQHGLPWLDYPYTQALFTTSWVIIMCVTSATTPQGVGKVVTNGLVQSYISIFNFLKIY